jgi:short subunit dehydrogenase-like uncharacterized protein
MACNIVLYGATGYSGRLIAGELEYLRATSPPGAYRIVLAGRDAEQLQDLAKSLEMEFTVFGLHDETWIQHALRGVRADVVINAAGPFACTAAVLVRAARAVGCHYTDINGEADVYLDMRSRDLEAQDDDVAVVGSAGFWAAGSDLLVDLALRELSLPNAAKPELDAIRIAMSRIRTFSRGSAQTVWQALRKDVTVVRKPKGVAGPLLEWQEPVGKLERTINFGAPGQPNRRIASAASLVDTLSARETVDRHGFVVRTIESYVEAALPARMAYQFGAFMAPFVAIPAVRAAAQQPVALLAEGPTLAEREEEPHVVVLEIEDRYRSKVIDWIWMTPNVYQFTAQLVVGIAAKLGGSHTLEGWVTPSEVLEFPAPADGPEAAALRGCVLHRRSG